MQNFTQAIRYGNSNREFIIGNVLGVLDNTLHILVLMLV